MTELTRIGLHYNRISDVSALSGLPKVREIDLRANEASDISPLLDLGSLAALDLRDNPLNNAAYCSDLSRLEQERPGIRVQTAPETPRPKRSRRPTGPMPTGSGSRGRPAAMAPITQVTIAFSGKQMETQTTRPLAPGSPSSVSTM